MWGEYFRQPVFARYLPLMEMRIRREMRFVLVNCMLHLKGRPLR